MNWVSGLASGWQALGQQSLRHDVLRNKGIPSTDADSIPAVPAVAVIIRATATRKMERQYRSESASTVNPFLIVALSPMCSAILTENPD